MKTLKINGKEKQFSEDNFPKDLIELLDQMNINQATVVAEIDGAIIGRKNFAETEIAPDQSIELIRFVGGG
jgi:thiamine biosynthesis protein ThiS